MDKIFDEMLDKYLPNFAQPVELKLPKLSGNDSNIPTLKKPSDSTLPKIKLPKVKKLGETANV